MCVVKSWRKGSLIFCESTRDSPWVFGDCVPSGRDVEIDVRSLMVLFSVLPPPYLSTYSYRAAELVADT